MKDTDYTQLLEQRMRRGRLSVSQQTDILSKLGLNIPERAVTDWDTSEGFVPDFSELLAAAGWGEYDFEKGLWTPSSNQIYSFDGEVYDLENMYVNFLKGLQAISSGELTFSDMVQDNRDVNWEYGWGTVHVSFRLNGRECRFDAEFQGDWLDVLIQDAVNRELEKLGVEKRFYATDGVQGNTIFFCTEEWARKFEQETLCFMSESGNVE